MKNVAIAFTQAEADTLRRQPVALVLIPPGIAIPERQPEVGGVAVVNLNRSMAPGAIVAASRRSSRYISLWMRTRRPFRLEEVASQNDVYQYHLRLQYYFLQGLEAFVECERDVAAFIFARPVPARYASPMRPETAFGHDPFDTYAYLASRLAIHEGIRIEAPAASRLQQWKGRGMLFCRSAVLRLVGVVGAFAKIAARDTRARVAANENAPGAVGIVLRTASEGIAAVPVIEYLDAAGIPYVLIRDELLASRTTARQLRRLNLPYLSIGTAGWRSLAYAVGYQLRAARRREPAAPVPEGAAIADQVLCEVGIWRTMERRLRDFRFLQRHFLVELVAIVKRRRLGLLVTFSYVDQWGPIVRHAGRACGIATVAIQNAAQDPELYPKLCWATHYCVESHYLKGRLLQLGYPSSRLTATGLSHFVRGLDNPARPRWDDPAKMQIAILTQPIYGEYFRAIIRVCCVVARELGCKVVVKYHPRQRGDEFDEIVARAGEGVRISSVHRESLDAVLRDATVAVSVVSAALLRAIFLSVPTFSLLPVEEQHLDLAYVNDPVMSLGRTPDELRERLTAALKDFPSFLAGYGVVRKQFLESHGTFEPTTSPAENVGLVLRQHLNAGGGEKS